MENDWLQNGETIVDSWPVYIGDETPTGAKITGRLFLTDQNVNFRAGISLQENAGTLLSIRIKAFFKSESHMAIPYGEIAGAAISKKLFLKSLQIDLKSGERLVFRFGATSPQKALDTIQSKI